MIVALVGVNIVLVAVIFVYVPLPHRRVMKRKETPKTPVCATTEMSPGTQLNAVIIF